MWRRFLGIVGLVIFLFGVVGSVFAGFVSLIVAHIIFGFLLLVSWGVLTVAVEGAKLTSVGSTLTGRNARFGYSAAIYVTLALAILVCVNWLTNRHNHRWDLTENKVYSLSDQSSSIVRGLKKPLKLVAFKGAEPEQIQKIEDLFTLYREQNPSKVSAELIDPKSKPYLIDQYQMKQENLVYIEYGDPGATGVVRINEGTEEAITNSVIKLTRGEAKKVYFVQGHDEPSIEKTGPGGLKSLADAIGDEHLKVEGLVLSKFENVPADAAAVVLVSPKKAMLPQEQEMLVRYGNSGGRLLLLSDPRTTSDVSDLAANFGVTIGKDVVIDQVQRLFEGPALGAQPIVVDYDRTSPITKSFSEQNITIFNIASTVTHPANSSEGGNYVDLAKSSKTAWGETNLDSLFNENNAVAEFDDKDVKGPVTLAVSFEKKLSPPKEEKKAENSDFEKVTRVVVYGDSDWVLNQNLNVYANRDLFLNSLNWLAGEEGGVSIRAGTLRAATQPILVDSFMKIFVLSYMIPEMLLLFGLMVWWRRRAIPA